MPLRELTALALAICLALAGCGETPPPAPCPPACNVLLVSIDTLRADHMSLYGYERETTPRIDAFAADALVFERATSQSAWTTPAHASMMTGLYPAEHGLVYYSDPGTLRSEHRTLAEILKKHGYRTAGFNGGGYVSEQFGLQRGFDIYAGSRRMESNIAEAIPWIVRNRREPFFAFVHGFDVHRPYLPPHRFDLFNDTGREWDIAQFCYPGQHEYESPEHLEYIVSQYDGGVRYADHMVGTLLDNLERERLLERTVVILTSDHGDEFFEHGKCDHIHSLYDELLSVPLIVRVPGSPGGRISARVAASVGIAPTVLDLLEIDYRLPPERSWRAWLEGATTRDAPVVSETGLGGVHLRSLIEEPWKLIRRTDLAAQNETYELYHLERDPSESTDLVRDHPDVVSAMAERLRSQPIPEPQRSRDFSPELSKELEALGYL